MSCQAVCESGSLANEQDELSIRRGMCTVCKRCTDACPSGALSWVGKEVDSADIIHEVIQDQLFYKESKGGITLSGGEPLLQNDFSLEILRECKAQGLHTAVETNLLTDKATLQAFIPWVDLWMCDLKIADEALHKEWTGHSNVTILKNMEYLNALAVPIIIRTPVIPGVNDSEQAIESICRFIQGLPNRPTYELLGFHSLGFVKFKNLGMKNPLDAAGFLDKDKLKQLNDILRKYNLNTKRG